MAIPQKIKTVALDGAALTNEVGLIPTRGKPVIVDEFFHHTGTTDEFEIAKWVYVGTGGTIVLQWKDFETTSYTVGDGQWLPGEYIRVLSAGTTATNMNWCGGM